MGTLFGLFVTLWALVGSGVTVHQLDGPVHFTDLYGNERRAPAALACPPDGRAVLWLGDRVDLETMVHELAHALDCSDDGQLNASPIRGERPAVRPSWVSDYCWESDAEWYACWVVHSGSTTASPLLERAAGAPVRRQSILSSVLAPFTIPRR